jgi:hypothetical protein
MHRETDFRRLTRPIYRQPRYRGMNLPLGFPAFHANRPAYYRRKPSILSRRTADLHRVHPDFRMSPNPS